ncbi:MAG: hypothetical protein L6R36_003939 [Xanthoria steineri]|nr:MAG: hypothetical protein L6R36_003939 [Xanthoria steineri]
MQPTAHALLFTATFLLPRVVCSPFSPARTDTLSMLNGNFSSLWPKISNTTNSPSDTNSLRTECSGEHFGLNPVISDCLCARDHISPDFVQHMWGVRHTGLPDTFFPLPYRIMGNRGLCFFQALLIGEDTRTARASLNQIRQAADKLIFDCATGEQSQGGIALNIGGDNQLAVALGTYEPTVQCRGVFGPEWTSCRDILGDMPAYKTEMVFGPRGAPGVQQPLPLRIESSDDKCLLQIFSTGSLDSSRWYRMWEAMTAVFSMCIRGRRGGVFWGIGDLGSLFLTVKPQNPVTLPGGGSASNAQS